MSSLRRIRLDLNTAAEKAVRNAMTEVESMDADERLTEATMKLAEAFNLIADYTDEQLELLHDGI